MSNSVQPFGLEPTRLFCAWDFPDKKTGVSCHFLLQAEARAITPGNVTETFYFKTDGTKEYNFGIYVGREEYPVSAVVYIKNVTVTRVYESVAQDNSAAFGLYELDSKQPLLTSFT